jgi:diacylglycerol kinase (ATP)
MINYQKVVLFYNKKSGQSDTDHQTRIIEKHFKEENISLKIVDITEFSDNIETTIQNEIEKNADLFIAAGGDGTVALVGNHLVGTEIPLGILPLGTGNLLAKELSIPRKIEDALDIVTSPDSERIKLDSFCLNEHHYFLNVSTGVTPKVMANTPSEEKQRLGFFAYLYHFIQQVLGLKLEKFTIKYDQHQIESHIASEILITNGRFMGVEPLEWSDDISLNDGVLEIFIIRAANFFDFIKLIVSVFTKTKHRTPIIKSRRFHEYCRIETPSPLKVQADGDPVGKTPIEVHVKPNALTIIVPNQEVIQAQNEKRKYRKEQKK